ncbi:MAG: hypothetical protein RLZZ192_256 [Pseudomonadota bacterium]
MHKKRIALVTATPMTIKAFMQGHIRAWAEKCDVTVFVNASSPRVFDDEALPIEVKPVRIERSISPWFDLAALVILIRQLRLGGYDAVVSVTPKAGLLAMLAAWAVSTPLRIHIFTGQVWATRKGVSRMLLRFLDRLTAMLATDVLADSESQRQFMIAEGVVSAARSKVLARGSICGVDTQRFRPDETARKAIRAAHGIAENAVLLLFLGRLHPDKGVLDLGAAFVDLADKHEHVHLLFVGPEEAGTRTLLERCCDTVATRVHFVDYTNTPERYIAAADIFCLPSYREGFGTVVIEAAAMGIPAVASRIYGLTDAVVDGETGLLHAPHDVNDLQFALARLVQEPLLRKRLGMAARNRAIQHFDSIDVAQDFAEYIFQRLLR